MKKIGKFSILPQFMVISLLVGVLFAAPLAADIAVDNFAFALEGISEGNIPPLPPIGGFGPGKKIEGKKEGKTEAKKEEVKKDQGSVTPKIQALLNFYTFLSKIKDDLKEVVKDTDNEKIIKERITQGLEKSKSKLGVLNPEVFTKFQTDVTSLPYGQNAQGKDIKNMPKKGADQIEKYLEWAKTLYDQVQGFLDKVENNEAWRQLPAGYKDKILVVGSFPNITFNKDLTDKFLKAINENKVEQFLVDNNIKKAEKPSVESLINNALKVSDIKNVLKDDLEKIKNKPSKKQVEDFLKALESKKDQIKNLSEEEKNNIKEIAEALKLAHKIGGSLGLDFEITSTEFVPVNCKIYDDWLKAVDKSKDSNNERTNEKVYGEIVKDVVKKFTDFRTNQKNYVYDNEDIKKLKGPNKLGIALGYTNTTLANTGEITYDIKDDKGKTKHDEKKLVEFQGKLKDFLGELQKLDVTNNEADRKALKADLYLILMYNRSLFEPVKKMVEKWGFNINEFLLDFYKLNINNIQNMLQTKIKNKGVNDKLDPNVQKDLDFAINFISMVAPYISKATQDSSEHSSLKDENEKKKAKEFVENINILDYYLQAILCKKAKELRSWGFDLGIIVNLVRNKANRDYCGWHVDVEQSINAPWDRHKTYITGNNGKKFAITEKEVIDNIILKDGRPQVAPEDKWLPVITNDPNKKFYRRYSVEFEEISLLIDKYEKAKNFVGIQNGIVRFIVSSINDFNYYLNVACQLEEQCTKHLCAHCFMWDLHGGYKPNGGMLQYDEYSMPLKEDGSYDKEAANVISQQVDDNLIKAKNFLEGIEGNDVVSQGSIDSALKAIGGIQAYKKGDCSGLREFKKKN